MKFIADGMLGKLTRWLRMLGQDVTYFKQLDDAELLVKAKEEGRILLTRDLELYHRAVAKSIEVFYVEGLTEAEKLAKLAERFNIALVMDMKISRCPRCNTRIESAVKEALVDKLEKNTYAYYDEFWDCPNCHQIYWQGAHWGRIRATLEEAEKVLKKKSVV